MQIKFILLLPCLLAAVLLGASNAPTPTPNLTDRIQDGLPCELPPPANFSIVEVGPISATFTWISVDWAEHRIRTYRASDGVLLNTTILPPGIEEARIGPLPSGTVCYSTINTICEDGGHGEDSERVEYRTVILEIIVAGFQPGNQQSSCPIVYPNGSCEFSTIGSTSPFKISYNNDSRQFGVKSLYGEIMQADIGSNGNNGQRFTLYCENGANPGPNPPCNYTSKIIIKHKPQGAPYEYAVAEFDLSQGATTGVGIFKCAILVSGYRIDRLAPPPGGLPSDEPPPPPKLIHDRGDSNTAASQLASTSPNPFSKSLDVFLGQTISEKIQLQMYNLSGQKVLDQQFIGGQEQYSLSTADLSPGFYMLRIEADGAVQTLKVIKSE